ncbi:hypothetical protein AB7M35_000928 [Amorphus suaedae]
MADGSQLPQERVRERAYQIWIEEGRPDGREADHWEKACELVAMEESGDGALLPLETGAGDVVEPPEALENQGDFPEMVDQGEGVRVPHREAAAQTLKEPTRRRR